MGEPATAGTARPPRLLLDAGADVNRVGWDDLTPLDAAERAGASDTATWLRSRGASTGGSSARPAEQDQGTASVHVRERDAAPPRKAGRMVAKGHGIRLSTIAEGVLPPDHYLPCITDS